MASNVSDDFQDLAETRAKTIFGHQSTSSSSSPLHGETKPEEEDDPETTDVNVKSIINLINCKNVTINNYYGSPIDGGAEASTVRQTCYDRENTDNVDDDSMDCSDDLVTDDCSSALNSDDESVTCFGAPTTVFVKGKTFHEAFSRLEQSNRVFLVGGLAEGKTALLIALAEYLPDYKIIRISYQNGLESELHQITRGSKVFAYCDDVFGKSYILNDRLKSWIKQPSPALIAALKSGQLKLGITCSKRIWSKVKRDFDNIKIFQSPVYLNWNSHDERVLLLQNYHCATGVKISSQLLKVCSQNADSLAFPYFCRHLLTGNASESQDESTMGQIIQDPGMIAAQQIEYLQQHSPKKYVSMAILVLQGGTLLQSQLSDIVKKLQTNGFGEEVWKGLITTQAIGANLCSCGLDLVSVFLADDNEYSVVDGFVFEEVAKRFAKTHAKYFLENAKIELVLDRCCVKTCFLQTKEPTHDISVLKEDYGILARVMTNQVINGNSMQVFANPSVNDVGFQEAWLSYLNQLPVQSQMSFCNSNFMTYLCSQLEVKMMWEYVIDRTPATSPDHMLCEELYSAAKHGEFMLLHRFRQRGINLNTLGDTWKTPAAMAVVRGKTSTLSALLHFGADPNVPNPQNKRTLIYLATKAGHKDAVDVLLKHTAMVNYPDVNKVYPLHMAAEKKSPEIMRRLLDHGANADVQDRWGKTPLHYAANSGHLANVRCLLNRGADVHTEDCNQQTVMHIAAKRQDANMMSFLLDKGSNSSLKDIWGKSAKDYAIENRSWNLLGLVDTVDSICEYWLV